MKSSRLLLFLAIAAAVAGCAQPKAAESVFNPVCDEYGVVQRVDTAQKVVYLVFTGHFSTNDDGYFENMDGLVPVLDTLADRGVKGSFFPTGNCFRVERYQAPIQRVIDEGHYLSAHSNHHLLLCDEADRSKTLVTQDSLATDIAGMEEELQKFGLTKEQFTWMIPPYEYYNQETADGLRSLGYKLCNPTEGIETSLDWMAPDADNYCSAAQLVQNIWDYEASCETGLNGCIILVHAMVYPGRTDEDRVFTHLGEIIDTLKDKGYSFGTFKELL